MQKGSWFRYTTFLILLLFTTYTSTTIIPITQEHTTRLTQTNTTSPAPNDTTTFTTEKVSCTNAPPFSWQRETRPKDRDCESAIYLLPYSEDRVQFHRWGHHEDGIRLPLNQDAGNCRVTITINDPKLRGLIDVASWIEIRTAARIIKDDSSRMDKNGDARTGGETMTGFYERIIVTLTKIRKPESLSISNIGNNLTALTERTADDSLTNNQVSCTKAPNTFQRERRPKSVDCSLVLHELNTIPLPPAPGQFHIQGADDGFRLPVRREVGKCVVEVTMRHEGLVDAGTWSQVRFSARSIWLGCQEAGKGELEERTGGTVGTGLQDGVLVRLVKVKRVGLLGVGNGTSSVDEILLDRTEVA